MQLLNAFHLPTKDYHPSYLQSSRCLIKNIIILIDQHFYQNICCTTKISHDYILCFPVIFIYILGKFSQFSLAYVLLYSQVSEYLESFFLLLTCVLYIFMFIFIFYWDSVKSAFYTSFFMMFYVSTCNYMFYSLCIGPDGVC